MLNRTFTSVLLTWSKAVGRRPLIVRGARQVGKTHTILEFGKNNFARVAEINFEKRPEFATLFERGGTAELLRNISRLLGVEIEPGNTLLFLDEVQECPKAIQALRYLYEEFPGLHVIVAGSLLDFTLRESSEDLRIPVGRIEFRSMHPLTFTEFLDATGNSMLVKVIDELSITRPPHPEIHKKLLTLINDYMLTGGMPAVVMAYKQAPYSTRFFELLSAITQSYREDFRKYRNRVEIELLEGIFRRIPLFVCKRFKFSELYPETQSRAIRRVIDLFEMARLVTKIVATNANGIPLEAESNPDDYKLAMVDIGLLGSYLGIQQAPSEIWNDAFVHAGALTEQFVGQELLALHAAHQDSRLYYWRRDRRPEQAEIDYITQLGNRIYPIEVKSGRAGHLKSLRNFIELKKMPFGIRISQHELSYRDRVLSVPLYGTSALARLVREPENLSY